MEKLKKRPIQVAEHSIAVLQEKIRKLTHEQGESLDTTLHADMLQIMEENTDKIRSRR